MKSNVTLLAAAAGALLLSAAPALADHHEAKDSKVKCEGVNSCKGQSECHSASNQCAGQNGCAGKGFKMLTQEECEAAKKKAKE
jgi:uncharacterized membrane protein